MPDKDKEKKFREDILAVAKQQDEKIQKLTDLLADNAKSLADLVLLIKEGKQMQPVATEHKEETYVVFTTSTQPATVMTKDEFAKRTQEVVALVKPILIRYGIAQLNAFRVEPK